MTPDELAAVWQEPAAPREEREALPAGFAVERDPDAGLLMRCSCRTWHVLTPTEALALAGALADAAREETPK